MTHLKTVTDSQKINNTNDMKFLIVAVQRDLNDAKREWTASIVNSLTSLEGRGCLYLNGPATFLLASIEDKIFNRNGETYEPIRDYMNRVSPQTMISILSHVEKEFYR